VGLSSLPISSLICNPKVVDPGSVRSPSYVPALVLQCGHLAIDIMVSSLLFSSTLSERSSVHSQFTPTPLRKSRILPKQKASIEHLNKSTFPSGCLFLFFPQPARCCFNIDPSPLCFFVITPRNGRPLLGFWYLTSLTSVV
jgi:hypothetical protein